MPGGSSAFGMLQPPHGPDQPDVPGEADLGYRLIRRFWRQGLASEGARELLRYGFVELGLQRIFGQTLAVNGPSRAVMSSIAMTYARTFPSASPEPLVAGSDRGESDTRSPATNGPTGHDHCECCITLSAVDLVDDTSAAMPPSRLLFRRPTGSEAAATASGPVLIEAAAHCTPSAARLAPGRS